jgi:Reverse transcriptase (RNA-dependent DNA polymerase)
MGTEVTSLEKQNTWDIVPKLEAFNAGKMILPGTWAFCCKCTTDGEIKKHKACYCVRGDLQKDVFETFGPVVQWTTVQILMVYALIYGLCTECIDFSNAFVQAELKDPVYIHLPRGSDAPDGSKDKCLHLKKSLYGLKIAPKLWYEHLHECLIQLGFRPSSLDPCLFFRKRVMMVCWVDNVCICAKDQNNIKAVINQLHHKFDLTEEGELSAYIGLKVQRHNNSFALTQQTLISNFINATSMENCNPKSCSSNQGAQLQSQ